MSSSDEKKFLLDLIAGYMKPWRPHLSTEDAELQDSSGHAPVEMLCLRRTQLTDIEESIVNNHMLKYLYLEGNNISSIPDSFFVSLPRLRWLDLRNNRITFVPAEIGSHTSLQTLLLEGNPISELPPELGNVVTLTGLNLRYCPITFPPQDIVDQGVKSILQYLRSALARRPVKEKKILPAVPPEGKGCLSEGSPRQPSTGGAAAAPPVEPRPSKKDASACLRELPEMEKLQLSQVTGSSLEEQDESVDEDELQRFRELKHKMILLDKAEQGLTSQNNRSVRPHAQKKKASTKAGVIPKLSLLDSHHVKKSEERKQVAQRDLHKQQTCLGLARKNQDSFRKWRTQAKMIQDKKISHHRLWELDKQEEVEADLKAAEEGGRDSCWSQSVTKSWTESEQQIHTDTEEMPKSHRNPKGTSTKQMAVTDQDGEEQIKRMQDR